MYCGLSATSEVFLIFTTQLCLCIYRNKGGICIPNSTTEVWTVDDVDLLNVVKVQLDQHVLSSDTLHLHAIIMQ